MSRLTHDLDEQEFDTKVLQVPGLVLLDFHALWCTPCRQMSAIVEDVQALYAGQITIYKIDVDRNPQTPVRFAVRGIPTFVLMRNGTEIARRTGALTKGQLVALVSAHLQP